jgi:hypothetical protein
MTKPPSGIAWANRLTRMLDQVFGPERFPVDVTALALDYSRQCFSDPITMVKGEALQGFEGGLFRGKTAWSIVYNDALQVRGRINFVLAHEFGHYLRHRHELDEFLCSQRDMIEWDREDQARETDANQFASYLLMPIADFRRQLAGQKVTLDGLAHCAERYGVSLTAAILKCGVHRGASRPGHRARRLHSVVTVEPGGVQVRRLLPHAECGMSGSRDVRSIWAVRRSSRARGRGHSSRGVVPARTCRRDHHLLGPV